MSEIRKSLRRFSFPDDEKRNPWLSLLMTAYALIDEGVSVALAREEKKRGVRPACRFGCDVCCRAHRDIPSYPIELAGMSWFVVEKMEQPHRGIVRQQLLGHRKGSPCPFLVDRACSVHLVRPAACRQFTVFTRECTEGEDPFYSRRHDVMTPIAEYVDAALDVTLPFYGITGKADRKQAAEGRLINARLKVLQEWPWSELALRMDDFDFSRQTSGR